MFNVVVAGVPKDPSGNPINVYYKVFFRYKDYETQTLESHDKQLVINLNDLSILGHNGYLLENEPIYIRLWQGLSSPYANAIRSAYKRLLFNGSNIIREDFILDETKTLSLTTDGVLNNTVYTLTPDIISTRVFEEMRYYVYVNINDVLETTSNYILVETIVKTSITPLVVTFKAGGVFKIISEALMDNFEVSESTTEVITVLANYDLPTGEALSGYIEWE